MSTINYFTPARRWLLRAAFGLGITLTALTQCFAALNGDCTLIVPANPLSAAGLATPYQLVATNPANGPCNETTFDGETFAQAAFVQAVVFDPLTAKIYVYNPLVIDKGTTPAKTPVVPNLPALGIVALWFGSNGDQLTLQGAGASTLSSADCHQGMGQFAYCNAAAFFAGANTAILFGALKPPALGLSPKDLQPCPSVRSFAVVDQDQSDNLPVSYLITPSGKLAQNTALNQALFPGWKPLKNPSDNGLTDNILDPALGCAPWKVSDLADPGASVPALPLNELQAGVWQTAPVAQVPLGDPFVLNNLGLVNRYRTGVNQFPAIFPWDASTATYCGNLKVVATQKLILDRIIFTPIASPFPMQANSLFTWMAMRLKNTWDNLACAGANPVTLIPATGTVTDAIIN